MDASASRNGGIIATSQSARSRTPLPGGMKCDVPGSTASCDVGQPGQVAHRAAAAQPEDLDRVLEP